MYGFHKIPHLQQGVLKSENDTEPWHFEHPHFHRGQPDLLCLIQRKKQSPHGAGDDIPMDLNDGPASATPLANLTPGQVLDINSIMNGISAIKRHQQAISADLNELKSSNQHLWQEALAARERHKKHQDTINRILKFLAGVFGNSEEVVKHDVSHSPPPVMPRKRQRLMIESSTIPEKRKAAAVEEVEDNDDHILGGQGDRVDPSKSLRIPLQEMRTHATNRQCNCMRPLRHPMPLVPHGRLQWLQATDLDPQSPTSLRRSDPLLHLFVPTF